MSSRMALTMVMRAGCISAQIGRNIQQTRSFARTPILASVVGSRARFYGTGKAGAAEPAESGTSSGDMSCDIKKLQEEVQTLTLDLAALRARNEELLDKYKRALAESENLRIRLTKQIEDAKVFGIQSFCKDLLEVADTLACATEAVPKEELDENIHLKNLYDGLNMTQASLLHAFKRHGLEQVNPMQEKFDPNFHEALFQKPDASVEPNTVVEVSKIGYTLHGRVVRPALVGVSKT